MRKIFFWLIFAGLLGACIPIQFGSKPTPTQATQPDDLEVVTSGDVLVFWERSGGIAGICQQMTIQKDGFYQILNCATNEALAQGQLDAADLEHLLDQSSKMASIEWKTPQIELVPDAFNDQYAFQGAGSNQLTEEEQKSLNEELATLAQRLLRQ